MWKAHERLDHYMAFPPGALADLAMDFTISHQLDISVATRVVHDVADHHRDLARAGRLVRIELPLALPTNQRTAI